MAGSKSRSKGQRGEREASELLSKLLGIPWRRSQQVKGTAISADIEPVEGEHLTKLWVEVKRDESTVSKKLYRALEQSELESGDNIPFVISRRNYEDWVFCIKEENLLEFCREVVRLSSSRRSPS